MRIIIFVFIMFAFDSGIYSQQDLPMHIKGNFTASGNCAFCHNNVFSANTYKDKDVSQSTLWRSTMMANASRDPFWRAKVDAELFSVKSKDLQKAASDLCLKCHAPMGFTQTVFDNHIKDYTIDKAYNDTLAFDGVSCTLCHQIQNDNLGKSESFAGNYKIGKEKKIFGPYKDPFEYAMGMHTQFTPIFGEQVNKSELCATCHTVITPHINENEEINGVFFEQTAYLEWKNSQYSESGIICQSCHMPSITEGIDIASRPPNNKTLRSPFFKHQFAGGNTTMQKLFIKNGVELKLPSESVFYEDKLKETEFNLNENALSLSADAVSNSTGVEVNVKLDNLTGHKLPTGIPFRRMWIHLTVKDNEGKIVFESGGYDAEGKINGLDENYEKHYNEITDANQVQIYQAVMVDLKGKSTFSLLKADKYVKDNRIPPAGFTTKFVSYDSSKIFGDALDDINFNKDANGNEGSGSDIVTYKIPNISSGYTVNVEVLYQSLDPLMLDYFKTYESNNISLFITMYNNANIKPVVMKSISVAVK
jgi:hypothetical protein